MDFRWIGPKRVKKVLSDLVYEITGLVDAKTEFVHAGRMKIYKADWDGKTVSKKLLEHVENSEAKYEMIENLINIGEDGNDVFIQVQWSGLPDKVDWT